MFGFRKKKSATLYQKVNHDGPFSKSLRSRKAHAKIKRDFRRKRGIYKNSK